ncbi:MAG: trigger factor [Stellaceae bacterium]
MQVTETSADGLKREYRIIVPADELEGKVVTRLDELGRTLRLPGFRPGKVPMQILRRRYGPSVLGEVLESTVQGSSADTIREHNLRPALPPKVDIVSFAEGADLEYNMQVEILPDIPEPTFSNLGIERLVVEVPGDSVDAAIARIAEQQRKSEPVERAAANGDIVVADLDGRIDGEEIPGAGGKDRQIMLGASGFIPGFDDQLVGTAAGEHRTVPITFPQDYPVPTLAGKDAVFEVDVKEVRERLPVAIDDELGKAVGLETLAELRAEVQQQMERDYAAAARLRLKRALLDKLAERYDFPVPTGMVELEFENIWAQHQAEQTRQAEAGEGDQSATGDAVPADALPGDAATGDAVPGDAVLSEPVAVSSAQTAQSSAQTARPDPATAAEGGAAMAAAEAGAADGAEPGAAAQAGDAGAADPGDDAEEGAKAEYRMIAERRVRLGLLLAEVGRTNNITVSQEEINQAITREVRRHPGYERQALDFYRQNPEAVANLRAPIFEDKVVDFIVELAKVEERRVTPQELLALPDADADNASGGEMGAPA